MTSPDGGARPPDEDPLDLAGVESSTRAKPSRRLMLGAGVLLGAGAVGAGIGYAGHHHRAAKAGATAGGPSSSGSATGTPSQLSDPPIVANGPLTVNSHVRLDHDLAVTELQIAPGGILEFAPDRNVTLSVIGNATVHGVLRMKPSNAGINHVLSFPRIDERKYTGGMQPVAGDIGVWVMGSGGMELAGAKRTAWIRAASGLRTGSTTLDLASAPVGWRPGDELAITPTVDPQATQHYDRYDYAVVSAVRGRSVTITKPLKYDHPGVSVGRGITLTAEVLNLTRNVRIEGKPTGRAHIWILSSTPQYLSNIAIRHMGPRQGTKGVLSRYALHFHTCGDGSRGSTVTNVVVRDCGNHAFVAHASHGIKFTGCISHNTMDDAYWWDQAPDTRTTGPATDDVVYQACVASRVTPGPGGKSYRMAGFNLSTGSRDSIHDCVAVGVQGEKDATGFIWPEGGKGIWDFANNVAHNNRVHGIFTWQNNSRAHVIERYVGYYNGHSGISHGAYNNAYHYRDSILYGNKSAGVTLHAVSSDGPTMRFDNLLIDGLGTADYAVEVVKHTLASSNPTQLTGCQFSGYTKAGVAFTYDGGSGSTTAEHLDVVDCTFSGNEFWLNNTVLPDSQIRLQTPDNTAMLVEPMSQNGTLNPKWNAKVSSIAPFASAPPAAGLPIRMATSSPMS